MDFHVNLNGQQINMIIETGREIKWGSGYKNTKCTLTNA
jgi:hypothetical protein